MKKIIFTIVLLFSLGFAYSQGNVTEFIKAGPDDAGKLFQAYLDPFAMALGDGLNNGWFYTAKTHDRFGFDFSMSISAIKVPQSAKTFDIGQISLSHVKLDNPSQSVAPTVAGSETSGPRLNIPNPSNPSETILSFNSPEGMGMDVIPVPVAQLGIGLLPHTDILVRYVPKLRFEQEENSEEDVKVGMVGFGAKHQFKDWIPGLKQLPFDASVFAAYSNITAKTGIDFGPSDYDYNVHVDDYEQDENQQLDIRINTLKIGLVLSKKIGFLTLFGGIGNSSSDSKVDLLGRYPVITGVVDGKAVIEDEIDPIKLRFKSSNLSLDAGFSTQFSFFNFFASVNKAEYMSFNAGLSLSVN